ncbi:IS3 family transposase [Bradyrhizobium sp. 164]|nr:IS3 family transposase [Bradyrhizobium sp. 164]
MSERATANAALLTAIRQVHQDSGQRYGSPRVHAVLRAQGSGASRGRIERLMHRHGIRAIMAPPRRVRTTDSRHGLPIAPNLIASNFTAAAPDRVWLADITYIPTAEGWLNLAAIILDASADAAIWLDTWSPSRELNLLVLRGRNKWG